MDAWDWGTLLVLRALWDDHLQLDRIPRRLGRGPRDPGGRELAERAFALVANRLLDPSSEHGLAYWLDAAYVSDDATRQSGKTPRVIVEFQWLQRWYRTLDRLVGVKEDLEVALFEQLRTLFEVQVELALYDITSTYFEGHGPPELARHGHSRDQRPRERQIVLGLVLIDGWPIAHHVFAGNRKDASTVAEVVQDLKQRFRLQRIVFVGDRGMIDDTVREELDAAGCGYLMGLSRRHNGDVEELLAEARRTPPEDWPVVPGPATQAAAGRRACWKWAARRAVRAGSRCIRRSGGRGVADDPGGGIRDGRRGAQGRGHASLGAGAEGAQGTEDQEEAAAGSSLNGERNGERPGCSDNSKMKVLVNKGKTCHNC